MYLPNTQMTMHKQAKSIYVHMMLWYYYYDNKTRLICCLLASPSSKYKNMCIYTSNSLHIKKASKRNIKLLYELLVLPFYAPLILSFRSLHYFFPSQYRRSHPCWNFYCLAKFVCQCFFSYKSFPFTKERMKEKKLYQHVMSWKF